MEKLNNITAQTEISPECFEQKAEKLLKEYEKLINDSDVELIKRNELINEEDVLLSLSKVSNVYIAVTLDTILGSVEIAIDKRREVVLDFVDPDIDTDTDEEHLLDSHAKPVEKRDLKYLKIALMMIFDLIKKNEEDLDEVVVCASDKQRERAYRFLTRYGFKPVDSTLDDGSKSVYYKLIIEKKLQNN